MKKHIKLYIRILSALLSIVSLRRSPYLYNGLHTELDRFNFLQLCADFGHSQYCLL